ncbi:spermatogenesis-associated serine-rich protein 1 [Hippopotamus amphibius kiboko]|uniref:spermatogenesis-associated serine-rich protein 1 n=1 Tax=Hippopotamus amphibius kiboko TaxID=575201 RepID=UPI002596BC91|nr:spermatogenesis-associated serine-rich protein 1 [Hippopotamus amphibius kiboko]
MAGSQTAEQQRGPYSLREGRVDFRGPGYTGGLFRELQEVSGFWMHPAPETLTSLAKPGQPGCACWGLPELRCLENPLDGPHDLPDLSQAPEASKTCPRDKCKVAREALKLQSNEGLGVRSLFFVSGLLLIFEINTCRAESVDTGNSPWDCHLPRIYTAICSSELEKVQERGDSGMTTGERRYSTKHNDFLESKGCFANITSSGRSVSPSSSIETGPSVSEPFSPSRRSVHLDPAAVLDLKSSSSHSDHSSEISLPEVQKDKCPKEFSLLKLQTKDGQRPEWTFYPRFSSNIHTYHVGKQCFFNGVFLGNRRSLSERTVDECFGRKKYVLDPRNGIPKLTPGDNTYMCPEQSKGFYKAGSTLPPVNFSVVPYEKKFDTFIPLEPLPQIPNLPFWVKEKANNLKNEIREVEELENWQPAVPLVQSLLPAGSLDFPRQF